jgi:hypothetical protein
MKKIIVVLVVVLALAALFIFARDTNTYRKLRIWLYGDKTKSTIEGAEKIADQIKDKTFSVATDVKNKIQEAAKEANTIAEKLNETAEQIKVEQTTDTQEKQS